LNEFNDRTGIILALRLKINRTHLNVIFLIVGIKWN